MQPSTTRDARVREPEQDFPRAFGAYVLLTSFAHGGMGEVYLAKSGGIHGIDRLCVLKKLRADVNANDEFVRRFLDEARVVVQLSHPHIAHVFDVGKVGREHYLAMEYISGANLKEIHTRVLSGGAPSKMPAGLALHVMVHVLDALDYAHHQTHPITGEPLHVVHRDVSPQNIMVSYDGDVKLIDFGLAASEIKTEHTESQVVMGKVAYMSPEQARGERVDARTDQFSAAIVLYELLVGDRFYGQRSNYDIWQVVGHGGFVPEKWDQLDSELTGILARALAKDPAHRFASCGDMKDAVERVLRKHHPDVGKRALRALMGERFQADRDAERRFLARFADVSAAAVRASTDDTPLASATASTGSIPPDEATEASAPGLGPFAVTEADSNAVDEGHAKPHPGHAAVAHEKTDPIRARTATTSSAPLADETGALVRATYGGRQRHVVAALVALAALLLVVLFVVPTGDAGTAEGERKTVVDTGPVDAKPVDAKPVDAKPVDAKPVDTGPVDAKPVDAKPVDAKPVDTGPVDAKPVDTGPVDAKPVKKPTPAKPDGPIGKKPTAKPTDTPAVDDGAPVDDDFVRRASKVLAAQQLERAEVLRMLGRCGHLVCASHWRREAQTLGVENFGAAQDVSMKACLEKCIER